MASGDDLDFETRYRVLRSTSANSRFRTHAALELRTGRAVMVHFADAGGPETTDQVRARIGGLAPVEARHVLEVATLSSGVAVVTEFLQGLSFFSEWLDARSAAPTTAASADQSGTSGAGDRGSQPAEFAPTVIIQSPVVQSKSTAKANAAPTAESTSASSSAPTVVRSAVKPSTVAVEPPAAEPPAAEPPVAVPPPVAPVAPVAPVVSSEKSEPGEFTRMFKMGGAPLDEPPAAPPAPPAQPAAPAATSQEKAEPGEFTRIFKAGVAPANDTAPVAPVAPIPDKREPGEFTRIFGAVASPAGTTPPANQPPAAVPPSAISNMATPAGAVTQVPSSPSRQSPNPTPSVPAAPIPDAKPGEYTQIFGAKSAPPDRAARPSPLSPPMSDFGGNLPVPPASRPASPPASPPPNQRGAGGSATSAFGAWGEKAPSPPSSGFGRSDMHSPSDAPPPPSSVPSSPFGAGALPPAGVSPFIHGGGANISPPSPPSAPSLPGRNPDEMKKNAPPVPSVPSLQPPVFGGVGLPPLPGFGDSIDSPFAKPSAPKPAGGYTQINKSVTPAPPPAVAQPAKIVATKRERVQLPTALVILIASVVVLAITFILYFALRAPARPLPAPATGGVTTPAAAGGSASPPSAATTTPPKNP